MTFGAEQFGVTHRVAWVQSTGRSNDTPPHQALACAKQVANRSSRTGETGFGRHFAVGENVARFSFAEDPKNLGFETTFFTHWFLAHHASSRCSSSL